MARKTRRSFWEHFSLPRIVGAVFVLFSVNGIIRTETTDFILHRLVTSSTYAHTIILHLLISGSGVLALLSNVIILIIGIVLIVFDMKLFIPHTRRVS